MSFTEVMEDIGRAIDVVGVVIIIGGIVYTTAELGIRRSWNTDGYARYRRGIGRAILLGLEILIAADIIRTIAVTPTFQSIGVLALIVLVRTFLSFTLTLETEGRWPWERRPEP